MKSLPDRSMLRRKIFAAMEFRNLEFGRLIPTQTLGRRSGKGFERTCDTDVVALSLNDGGDYGV
jgi:hypothetical protein